MYILNSIMEEGGEREREKKKENDAKNKTY